MVVKRCFGHLDVEHIKFPGSSRAPYIHTGVSVAVFAFGGDTIRVVCVVEKSFFWLFFTQRLLHSRSTAILLLVYVRFFQFEAFLTLREDKHHDDRILFAFGVEISFVLAFSIQVSHDLRSQDIV
jgi:hypothetical protein